VLFKLGKWHLNYYVSLIQRLSFVIDLDSAFGLDTRFGFVIDFDLIWTLRLSYYFFNGK